MELSLFVINEANKKFIIFERYDYTQLNLTPRYARRASVLTKMVPCWVSDGNRIYRVTHGQIILVERDQLRHWVVRHIDDWLLNGNKVPDYFFQVR